MSPLMSWSGGIGAAYVEHVVKKRFEWKLKFRGEVDEAHHEEDRKWAVGFRKVSKGAKRISPAQWHAVRCIWEDALLDFSDQVHAIIPYKLVWWEMDQNFDVELDGLSPAGVPMWIWRLEFAGMLDGDFI